MTTQTEIRESFWEAHPQFVRKHGATQNDYCADIRCTFVDYVDSLQRNGVISEELSSNVTL